MILFLLPLPPPFAGPEKIAQEIRNSDFFQKMKGVRIVNTNIRNCNKNKGLFDINGIIIFIRFYIKNLKFIVKSEKIFFYLSSSRAGFIRDSVYILTCWLLNKDCIAQYHGSYFDIFYNNQSRYIKLLITKIISRIKIIIVYTENLKKIFDNIYFGKIETLSNGLKNYDSRVKNQYNDSINDMFRIIYISHLDFAKGFYDLVDAYKLLFKKYENKIELYYSGENFHFNKCTIERLKEEYRDKYVNDKENRENVLSDFINNSELWNSKYLGVISEETKYELLRDSDLFVLPSYTEGLSMACLEAMAIGLPAITTPVGAMPEIVRHMHGGIITEIGNPIRLANDIEYFIQHRTELKRMGKYNIEYIKKFHNIEKIVRRLFEILES